MLFASGDIIPQDAREQIIFDYLHADYEGRFQDFYQLTAPDVFGSYKDFATGKSDHRRLTGIALREDGRSEGRPEEIRYLVYLSFYKVGTDSTYIWVIPDRQHPGKWLISGDKFR